MALLFKQLFGGGGAVSSAVNVAAPSAALQADPDFADFAGSPAQPVPPSHAASSAFSALPSAPDSPLSFLSSFVASTAPQNRPFTKWYRVWERVTIADFYQEMFIIPTLLVFLVIHLVGASWNKSVAKKWAATYIPLVEAEYAQMGFKRPAPTSARDEGDKAELAKNLAHTDARSTWSEEVWKQKKINEFDTYATGRANAAWTDIKLSLHKRFNPALWGLEVLLSFFIEGISKPTETMSATTYCFDGKEKTLLPSARSTGNSSYDGFVWAVVHKDHMQKLRDDRYDLSLTATRDNHKLPNWATVMTESAEISDAMLTPELIKAIEAEGEALHSLIITDMPIDAPKKLNDLLPRKRISLTTSLPTSKTPPTKLFSYFLRLPDTLASTAHFRPEALRKIKGTREEEARKIRKLDEEEKAEERKTASDKMKKEERERKLKGLSAEEQRKFLERERGEERKKGQKRMTMKA